MHHHYISAGCIGIRRSEIAIDPSTWDSIKCQGWITFKLSDDGNENDNAIGEEPNKSQFLAGVQASILQAAKVSSCARLFKSRWIRLEFGISSIDDQLGILRVHVLPDDVQRRAVDRSDAKLVKARKSLLQILDYSAEAWQGQRVPIESGAPLTFDGQAAGAGACDDTPTSLLRLFNTIPSPNPDPQLLLEPFTQEAMYNLLEGGMTVDGLVTPLYPYQRRSAALMLQKETHPGQVLDPRLLQLKDAKGSPWYMDPVAGVVLLEPRYYDGVSGGILAEEMGAGKTIICLSLILASRHLPTQPPEFYAAYEPPKRKKIASLVDMAASCATRHAVPWKPYFAACKQHDLVFEKCEEALRRNHPYYLMPVEPRRRRRESFHQDLPSTKVYLSSASLIVVPNNLVHQWRQEIQKHTEGLNILFLTGKGGIVPPAQDLLDYDIILFSHTRFVEMAQGCAGDSLAALSSIHFKRCIVDEGHKLGNSKVSNKSKLLLGLDALKLSSRWVVTGTPSRGLFGVDHPETNSMAMNGRGGYSASDNASGLNGSSTELERNDLERLGSMTALFLKARPWANTTAERGDTVANWRAYLMLPKHHPKGQGRWDCLRSTLNSLIVRHRLAEVSNLLPPVDEKVVILDGSYQDQLSLNLFSMMIVFNSVQSQRTDMDYFFHSKQRQALLQIVHNLKQATFFGGSFFTDAEIQTSVTTAEKFLRDKAVPISPDDELLLQEAMQLGQLALENDLRNIGNQFHEMALRVSEFPAMAGPSWSLLGDEAEGVICTSASMMLAIQRLIYNAAGKTLHLNTLLNGGLVTEGDRERRRLWTEGTLTNDQAREKNTDDISLAGQTTCGDDKTKKPRLHATHDVHPIHAVTAESLPEPFERTMITSTVSAKLKYLVDNIVKYQDDEKIIVFYEIENSAWYLAHMLDVLQIQYLVYARGMTSEQKAQYVNTFHHNPEFSVLIMDLSQAAFGLDMREASRIYFLNPVLNPQVEAQAIGRVRRISQIRPVSVETLVLRNSIDEVILERKQHMTQAEHRQAKSILDIRPIYNWIKNARVMRMRDIDTDEDVDGYRSQMVDFETPRPVFGKGFGRTLRPNDGIIMNKDRDLPKMMNRLVGSSSLKRAYDAGPGSDVVTKDQSLNLAPLQRREVPPRPVTRIRFLDD